MFVLGVVGDTPYKILLLLHIFAVIVAFAPSFVWPFVAVRLKRENRPPGATIHELAGGNTAKITGPAMILAGIFGFGLIGLSDSVWEFSQSWISIAMLLWFLAIGVIYGLMVPAEKQVASGNEAAESRLSMAGGMLHLLLFLLLVTMIWKPFL